MPNEYSIEVYRQLEQEFRSAHLHRPMQVERYEPGTVLDYAITGVAPAHTAQVRVEIVKFVGGGFAGQVYRVKVIEVFTPQGPITGVEEGAVLAMKILVPPSRFSELFRNTIYGIGFQGPFQLQVNPAAARAGALWQKFIRRGAKIHFGDERSVVDIYATFADSAIGSCADASPASCSCHARQARISARSRWRHISM